MTGWFRLAPVAFLLLWSTGFTMASIGLRDAPPLTFLMVRYVAVLLLLVPVLAVVRPPLPRSATVWRDLAVVGLLVQFAYFALNWAGLAYGAGIGVAALIGSLQPVIVAALQPALGGPHMGRRGWAGLALGLAGAGVVILSRTGVQAPTLIGVLLAFGSLAGISAGALYEKRSGGAAHPLTAAAVQYAVGLAGTLPLAFLLERVEVRWTPSFIGALAYLVVANSLVAITLLLAMIRRGEVARVSALFYLVPPLAALIGWALVGEPVGPLAWAGMALAAVGVALVTARRSPPPART